MNVIFVSLDSLNRHFLTAYGNDGVRTPNITDFAARSCVFDNHFVGSVPCMPARRELWTGTQEFWWRWWGPIEPFDQPLAYHARQAGVKKSMLVTDHYHFFEWGSHGYQNDFDGYEFIRGHELDNWRTDPPARVPDWAEVMIQRDPARMEYVANVQDFKGPDDFFAPRTFAAAVQWLDRNGGQGPFYLHIDEFDPHEPFHVPEPYRSMYSDDDYRKYSPWPRYGRIDEGASQLSDAELAWVRAQYAGKVSMCDDGFGRLLDAIDRNRLWDDTVVILTTDHGHYLGDHGWVGKPRAPLYRTLTHIPLMIWHPGGQCNGRRTAAITSAVDLYATMLECLGAAPPDRPNIHSRSLLPVIRGGDRHRDFAFYGYCNSLTGVTDGQWAMTIGHDNQAAPSVAYSQEALMAGFGHGVRKRKDRQIAPPDRIVAHINGVDNPVWRAKIEPYFAKEQGPWLWDVANDPAQEREVSAERPEQIDRLRGAMRDYMRSLAVPEEQYARLHL